MSIGKRMPNVWTDRQRGNKSAQPSGGPLLPANPRNRCQPDLATTTRIQN